MKNKSLKIGLISAMTIILVALIGYIVVIKLSDYKREKQLMRDFNKYLNSEELSIIYYMHTGCPFCEMQGPILEQIAKDYNLDYLQIDSTKLFESDKNKIVKVLENKNEAPTIAIVQNGEVKAKRVGYLEGHKLVNFFIQSGILEENSTYKPEEGLTFIGYDDFKELKDSGTKVVVLGSVTCEYCKASRPILSNISKAYNVPIHYLSLNSLTTTELNEFAETLKDMKYDEEKFKNEGKFSTPSLLVIKDGKVTSYLNGYHSTTEFTKYLKDQKIIKE